ncbi:MAG: hypothetical protein VYD19_05970 [Myxococcota bacterium]|nr:hypothetical protein [Myxococcota bacterium]
MAFIFFLPTSLLLISCYLTLLRFPLYGLLIHSLLAIYLLWPIAVAFREHKWRFYLRQRRARFRATRWLRWLSNAVLAAQLAGLGLLFFCLSCRCAQDPFALFLLPMLTCLTTFGLVLLGRREESAVQLSRYAFVRLSLFLGLTYSLLLQLWDYLQPDQGVLANIVRGLHQLLSFLRGVAERDFCEAYRGLDGSLNSLLSLPPRPISTVLKVFLQVEIAFGLLMSLYVIACLKLFRVDDHQDLRSSKE